MEITIKKWVKKSFEKTLKYYLKVFGQSDNEIPNWLWLKKVCLNTFCPMLV